MADQTLGAKRSAPYKSSLSRRYIVYPRVQLGLVFIMVIVGLLIPMIFLISRVWLPYIQVPWMGPVVFVNSLLFLAFMIALWKALDFSNRIVGPIYRLHGHIRQTVSLGKSAGPVAFRKNDCFSELATDYSRLLDLVETLRAENEALKKAGASTQLPKS